MASINMKQISSIAIAVVSGVAAVAGTLADKKKTEKMEELIKKVESLTEQN